MDAPEKKQDSQRVLLSCLTTSEIWLNTLMDGGQSTQIDKVGRRGKKTKKKKPCKLVWIIYQVCTYFSFLS
jgi:hypothetical protein